LKEYYRSAPSSPDTIYVNSFPSGSSIHYLSTSDQFHRVKGDELWHYYEGDVVDINLIIDDTTISHVKLGVCPDCEKQYVVPSGVWYYTHLQKVKGYSLHSVNVLPAWTTDSVEYIQTNYLLQRYPLLRAIILRLIERTQPANRQ